MNDIIVARMEPAVRALAECSSAEEAKRVVDIAHAAAVLARRQKLGEEAIAYATGVKVDAMALLGEMLKEGAKNEGGRPAKTSTNGELVSPPTQEELLGGGGRKVASDSQALADLKEDDPDTFEQVRAGKVTIRKGANKVRAAKRKKKKTARLEEEAAAPDNASPTWQVVTGDCFKGKGRDGIVCDLIDREDFCAEVRRRMGARVGSDLILGRLMNLKKRGGQASAGQHEIHDNDEE